MTLLSIIQDVADLVGIPRPASIVNSSDTQVRQLLAYCNRAGKRLAERHSWQALTRETTFTSVNGEDQGLIETLAPGFNWDFYRSWWNRTSQDRLGGPLTPQNWQLRKASVTSGPNYQYRIRGNHLLVNPGATAGDTLALEYVSRYWCQSNASAPQDKWAADNDTGVLPEDLLTLETHWRFLRAKGLSYAEEKQDAEIAINLSIARDGSNAVLFMDSEMPDASESIGVPEGNWNL